MIVTLTLNPAIDKTVVLERVNLGGLNRIEQAQTDAGGKGINVSKLLAALGERSLALGLLGREEAGFFARRLEALGIAHDFVLVEGATRTNLKVFCPQHGITEFNESGFTVPGAALEALNRKLCAQAGPGALFVLSGSLARGLPEDLYFELIGALRARGAKVFLDADGAAMRAGLRAAPALVKPNDVELAAYCGLAAERGAQLSREALRELAGRLLDEGVETVALSLGARGALFLRRGRCVFVAALPVEVKSTVGAGDSMVAALAYAETRGLDFDATCRLAMAAATGAVMTEGTNAPAGALIERLAPQFVLEEL